MGFNLFMCSSNFQDLIDAAVEVKRDIEPCHGKPLDVARWYSCASTCRIDVYSPLAPAVTMLDGKTDPVWKWFLYAYMLVCMYMHAYVL